MPMDRGLGASSKGPLRATPLLRSHSPRSPAPPTPLRVKKEGNREGGDEEEDRSTSPVPCAKRQKNAKEPTPLPRRRLSSTPRKTKNTHTLLSAESGGCCSVLESESWEEDTGPGSGDSDGHIVVISTGLELDEPLTDEEANPVQIIKEGLTREEAFPRSAPFPKLIDEGKHHRGGQGHSRRLPYLTPNEKARYERARKTLPETLVGDDGETYNPREFAEFVMNPARHSKAQSGRRRCGLASVKDMVETYPTYCTKKGSIRTNNPLLYIHPHDLGVTKWIWNALLKVVGQKNWTPAYWENKYTHRKDGGERTKASEMIHVKGKDGRFLSADKDADRCSER